MSNVQLNCQLKPQNYSSVNGYEIYSEEGDYCSYASAPYAPVTTPPLPAAAIPVQPLFHDAASTILKDGHLEISYALDKNGTELENYMVYWHKASEPATPESAPATEIIAQYDRKKLPGIVPEAGPTPNESARKAIIELQRKLAGIGYLGEKSYIDGKLDKTTVFALIRYFNANHKAGLDLIKAERELDKAKATANRNIEKYNAWKKDPQVDRHLIAELVKRMLDDNLRVYRLAEDYLNMLPAGWEKEEKYRAFGEKCQSTLNSGLKINKFLLKRYLDEAGAKIDTNAYINLEFKKINALIGRYNKKKHELEQDPANAELLAEKKRLYSEITSLVVGTVQALKKYSDDFADIPGVKGRCEELIKKSGGVLKALGIELPADLSHLAADLNSFGEHLGDIKAGLNDKSEKKDEKDRKAELVKTYALALKLSNKAGAQPARAALFTVFYQFLRERKSAETAAFKAFLETITSGLDEKDLQTYGQYLYEKQKLSDDGKSSQEIEADPKIAELRAGAQKITDKIQKYIEDHKKERELEEQIGELFYLLYRHQSGYKAWTASQPASNSPAFIFKDAIKSALELTGVLMDDTAVSGSKVFSILLNLPEVEKSEDLAEFNLKLVEGLKAETAKEDAVAKMGSYLADKKRSLEINQTFVDALTEDYDRQTSFPLTYSEADLKSAGLALPEDTGATDSISDLDAPEPAEDRFIVTSEGKVILAGAGVAAPAEYQGGGAIYRRKLTDFMDHEGAALLKLYLAERNLPVSDRLRLGEKGLVTTRLTQVDIESLIKAFSPGRYFFAVGDYAITPAVGEILGNLKKTGELSDKEKTALTKLLGGSELMFDGEEKAALSSLAQKISTLTPAGKVKDLLSAADLEKVKDWSEKTLSPAIAKMSRKDGLRPEEIALLTALTKELKEKNTEIDDPTLSGLSQSGYPEAYLKALPVLKNLRWQVLLLATKYPPEKQKALGFYIVERYGAAAWEGAKEAVSLSNPQTQTMLGLPEEEIYELNTFLIPDASRRLTDAETGVNTARADLISALQKWGLNNYVASLKKITDPDAKAGIKDYKSRIKAAIENIRKKIDEKDAYLKGLKHQSESGDFGDGVTSDDFESKWKNNADALKPLYAELEILQKVERSLSQLANLSGNISENPLQFITSIEQLQTLCKILKREDELKFFQIDKETVPGTKALIEEALKVVLTEIEPQLKTIIGKLPELKLGIEKLRAAQDGLEKIMQEFNSDSFSKEKWDALKAKFEGLFGKDWQTKFKNELAGFAEEILLGSGDEILGPDGHALRLTPEQILDRYFNSPKPAAISLSSLQVVPGEARETTLAKMALGKILEKITHEQHAKLVTAFSSLLSNHGEFLKTASYIFAGELAVNGGEISVGPQTPEELVKMVNQPSRRTLNNFYTFVARNTDSNPPMNLSGQFKMFLAGRPEKGQAYLKKLLEQKKTDQYLFQEIGAGDVDEFIKYLNEELIPLIQNNPRLRAKLVPMLVRESLISPLIQQVVADAENGQGREPKTYTSALYKVDIKKPEHFKLKDWLHADETTKSLSRVFQDVTKINAEINKSSAHGDYKDTAVAYFNPLEALEKATFAKETEPLEEIPILHTDPAGTNLTEVGAFRAQIKDSYQTTREALAYALDEFERLHRDKGLAKTILDLLGENAWGAVKGVLESVIRFYGTIPLEFKVSLINLVSDAEIVAEGALDYVSSGGKDRHKLDEALNKFAANAGKLFGSASAFELLGIPQIYEGLGALMKDPLHNAGKGAAILAITGKMLLDSFRNNKALLIHGYKWTVGKLSGQRVGRFKLPPHAGLGVKVLYYHAFGWYELYVRAKGLAAYSKGKDNFAVEIKPDYQLSSGDTPAGEVKGFWNGLGKFREWYAQQPIHPYDGPKHLIRKGESYVSGKIAGAARGLAEARLSSVNPSATADLAPFTELLKDARNNPGKAYTLDITPRHIKKAKEHKPKPKRISITGKDLWALANSRSVKDTAAIIKRVEARTQSQVFNLSDGTMGDLHNSLVNFRTAVENIEKTPVAEASNANADAASKSLKSLIDDWARGKKLTEIQTLRSPDGTVEIELNGSKIAKLVSGDIKLDWLDDLAKLQKDLGRAKDKGETAKADGLKKKIADLEARMDQDYGFTVKKEGNAISVSGREALEIYKAYGIKNEVERVNLLKSKSVRDGVIREIETIGEFLVTTGETSTTEEKPSVLSEKLSRAYGTGLEHKMDFGKRMQRAANYDVTYPPTPEPVKILEPAAETPLAEPVKTSEPVSKFVSAESNGVLDWAGVSKDSVFYHPAKQITVNIGGSHFPPDGKWKGVPYADAASQPAKPAPSESELYEEVRDGEYTLIDNEPGKPMPAKPAAKAPLSSHAGERGIADVDVLPGLRSGMCLVDWGKVNMPAFKAKAIRWTNTKGAPLAAGIVGGIGTENLLDLVGVDNKFARFGGGLAGGHGASLVYQKFFMGEALPTVGHQLGGLGAGLTYSFLADDLYNGVLNMRGVSTDSWLRGDAPRLGVSIVSGLYMTDAAASSSLAGYFGITTPLTAAMDYAVLPLAIVSTVNKVPEILLPEKEVALAKTAAKDNLYAPGQFSPLKRTLLDLPMTNNLLAWDMLVAQGPALWKTAQEPLRQAAEIEADLRKDLKNLWQDGTGLPAALGQKVEFKNDKPGTPGGVYAFSAYQYVTSSAHSDLAALTTVLKKDYNIKDPEAFLRLAGVKIVQEKAKALMACYSEIHGNGDMEQYAGLNFSDSTKATPGTIIRGDDYHYHAAYYRFEASAYSIYKQRLVSEKMLRFNLKNSFGFANDEEVDNFLQRAKFRETLDKMMKSNPIFNSDGNLTGSKDDQKKWLFETGA